MVNDKIRNSSGFAPTCFSIFLVLVTNSDLDCNYSMHFRNEFVITSVYECNVRNVLYYCEALEMLQTMKSASIGGRDMKL